MQVNNTKNINFVAIIAEYNPLHAGHLAHIQQAKQTGLPLVVVLGGDFCQRGGDMFFDKYTRAEHALEAGADLVLEMPTVYATDCAEQFAKGGVRQLAPLGAGILSFGSECGDIDTLQGGMRLLVEEPPAVSETLRKELDQAPPTLSHEPKRGKPTPTKLGFHSPRPTPTISWEWNICVPFSGYLCRLLPTPTQDLAHTTPRTIYQTHRLPHFVPGGQVENGKRHDRTYRAQSIKQALPSPSRRTYYTYTPSVRSARRVAIGSTAQKKDSATDCGLRQLPPQPRRI